MRHIYSSPRIENAERLVAAMAEHGIETQITNHRVYDHRSYRSYSYGRPGNSEDWPAVWVTHAKDHSRARELMREFGLDAPKRFASAPDAPHGDPTRRDPASTALRIRMVALVVLVIGIALYGARMLALW